MNNAGVPTTVSAGRRITLGVIGIVLAGLGLMENTFSGTNQLFEIVGPPLITDTIWVQSSLFVTFASLILSGLLLAASVLSLQNRPLGYALLRWWAGLTIALSVGRFVIVFWTFTDLDNLLYSRFAASQEAAETAAQQLLAAIGALSIITVVFPIVVLSLIPKSAGRAVTADRPQAERRAFDESRF